MKVYLQVFVNYIQDNWSRLIPIVKFFYNNPKNNIINHTSFKLNYYYHPRTSYEKNVDPHLQSKFANKIVIVVRDQIMICKNNLKQTQELEKLFYNKYIKRKSYSSGEKVQFNNKYIKSKRNQKLELKFFDLFKIFQSMKKQDYKLELLKKWKLYDIFHVSILEQQIIRRK